ncbi:PspC domain-containing protein [Mucilaginibacter sp. dw_454]|uniref:PspC domain-containing protein n=1 Tax=Mucilaginibacter sp. dw_454 TaxID=2720079 RepID=UPI001BD3B24B|nr:PspC domain-containing protein [Mucilaginibacter sp. dw_454]
MNKTIIININGTVFHIEEDAYEILKSYMTDVKRHFMNSADSHEITTDIENRIAEMFSEILAAEEKQVIVEQDVKTVVEQMGTVQDFENAENDAEGAQSNYTYNNSGTRTLFRDPDDHLLGGVCAGLANYFGTQTIWLRLAFAFSVLFFGTGLFLYIILWIVIPKAVTRADRMAMKGEKLNLQGFKNNLEEELSAVRDHLTNLHAEARPMIYKFRDFVTEFVYLLGKLIKGAGHILIKLIGIVILIACLAGTIALVAMLVTLAIWTDPHSHLFPYSVMTYQYANRLYYAGFFAAFIPVLFIFLLTLKAVFNTRGIDKSVGSVLFVAWLFAVGVVVFYGTRIAAGFRSSASFNQTVSLATPSKNIYYLKINDVKYFTHDDSTRLNMKSTFKGVVITNENTYDDFRENNMSLHIEKSDVAQPILVETFRARGNEYEDALLNARNTKYIFTQTDTLLTFDRYLQRLEGTPWRDQEIELTLKVPVNAVVMIDSKMGDFLRDGIDINQCRDKNKTPDAPNAPFIMMNEGLTCKVDTLVAPVAKVVTTTTVTVDTIKAPKKK